MNPDDRPHPSTFGPLISAKDLLVAEQAEHRSIYSDPEYHSLRSVARYAREFLARPHADLGRAGPVCPFIWKAVADRHLVLTACRRGEITEHELSSALLLLRDQLIARRDSLDADQRLFASVIATLPHLATPEASRLVRRVQASLKPDFVAAGLMIGEFFPGCPSPGLHSDGFRPLDAPAAFIAMRSITVQDAPFMIGDDRYVRAFLGFFGKAGAAAIEAARSPAQPPLHHRSERAREQAMLGA